MRKIKLFYIFATFLCSIVLVSCGSFLGAVNDQYDHDHKLKELKQIKEECLASAQSESEKEDCDNAYQEAVDEENERFNNMITNKDNADKFQRFVLEEWGYDKKIARQTSASLRNSVMHNDEEWEFDPIEAINELLKIDRQLYMDYEAVKVFENELPKFGITGLSKDSVTSIVRLYYEDELYTYRYGYPNRVGYPEKNQYLEDCYQYNIGSNAEVAKEFLVDYGLIDEEEEEDIEEEEEDIEEEKSVTNDSKNNSNQITSEQHSDPTQESINNDSSDSSYEFDVNKIVQLSPSGYQLNSSELTKEQEKELDEVVGFLRKYPNAKITVIGHTCSLGSDKINNKVGQRRAQQAKSYLIEQGIDENRIEEVSKGATEPCSSNDTNEGRLQNRRITFIVK